MSNPTYTQGPISKEIAGDLDKFRLVTLNAEGKIAYAAAEGAVFGAITEAGRLDPKEAGAKTLAVHYGVAAVKLETTDTIKAGAAVYSAADGKVASTGTVQVGVAVEPTDEDSKKTLTILNGLPTAGA